MSHNSSQTLDLELCRQQTEQSLNSAKLVHSSMQNKANKLKQLMDSMESSHTPPSSSFLVDEFYEVYHLCSRLRLLIDLYSVRLSQLNYQLSDPTTNPSHIDPAVGQLTLSDSSSNLLPDKYLLRAYLPDQQITSVEVRAGQSIQDAFEKKFSQRKMVINDFSVFRLSDRSPLEWTDDAYCVARENDELLVEPHHRGPDFLSPTDSYYHHEHQFRQLSFPAKIPCGGCHKMMSKGVNCKICGLVYHSKRCADKFASRRQQHADTDDVFRTGESWGWTNTRQFLNLAPRERSSSTPNMSNPWISRSSGNIAIGNYIDPSSVGSGKPDNAGQNTGSLTPNPCINHHSEQDNSKGSGQYSVRGASEPKQGIESHYRNTSTDIWEIPASKLVYGKRIGSGSFGTVFKGYWHGDVAIKQLNVSKPTAEQLEAFRTEADFLRGLRHQNILYFLGVVYEPSLAIVTAWCDGSSLYKHLHVDDTKLTQHNVMHIAKQTAQGMIYLHHCNIIHRDLKSSNIFLHGPYVMIGDFGLATIKSHWSDAGSSRQPSGSILWMAPEIIYMKAENPYTNASDVYAFGIVLYEMITGELPYPKLDNRDQILFMVGSGRLKPDWSRRRDSIRPELGHLAERCCLFKRDERPSFDELLVKLETWYRNTPRLHRSRSVQNVPASSMQRTDLQPYFAFAYPLPPASSSHSQFAAAKSTMSSTPVEIAVSNDTDLEFSLLKFSISDELHSPDCNPGGGGGD